MNNNRSNRSGYSGRPGTARNTGYRNHTDYARDYPDDNRYTGDYPDDNRYTGDYPDDNRYTGDYPDDNRYTGGYPDDNRYTGDYPDDNRYTRDYPDDNRYTRGYPDDNRYTRGYPADNRYTRGYPENDRAIGGGRRSSYESPKGNDSNLPLFLLAGLGIVIVIVILITVSLSLSNKGGTNKNTGTSTGVSDSDKRQATVIGFDDDDEEESGETSSDISYKNFVGTWKKTDVLESRKATVTVTAQYDDSFDFTLKMWSGEKTAAISGTAFFTGESTAVFKQGAASVTLEQGSQYLSIYHSGKNKAFGIGDDFDIDGKFTQGTPKYIKEEETVSYDYNIYQSDAVVKALSSTLSPEDYSLYKEMMAKGLKSPIPYERTLDKNGKKVNVDTELNAVKYYAHLSGIGADMIFICSNDAKIYVLFYDTEEMWYYTNDSNYASQMPASFRAVEKANIQKAVFK